MPNWCECDLIVSGNRLTVEVFEVFAASVDKVLDENNFIPYPEKFRKMDEEASRICNQYEKMTPEDRRAYIEKHGYPCPYSKSGSEWREENWGTDSGICHPQLTARTIDGETIMYWFISTFTPPIPIVTAMGQRFQSLNFQLTYFEALMGFHGIFVVKNGEVVKQEEAPYYGRRGG